MNIAPQLRPLGIGDLFDAAFRLYRERFWTLIAIAAVVYVPTAILRLFLWPGSSALPGSAWAADLVC
jgi:hypothetical protein